MDMIASLAGVSKTTVHRALSNSGRISQGTRDKILKIADDLGYRPNLIASGLRRSRTGTLGFVVSGISGTFFSRVLEGMEDEAQRNGLRVFLCSSQANWDLEQSLVKTLVDSRVDGIVVSSVGGSAATALYRRLLASGIKLVVIDNPIAGVDADLVSCDHSAGGYLLGRHMAALGYRDHAFVALPIHPDVPESLYLRVEGYNRALKEHGLAPLTVYEGDLREAAGDLGTTSFSELCRRAMNRFLTPHLAEFRHDAIFAQYDHLALATIDVLKSRGLRIPDDLAVVGFDDQDFTEYVDPPLTTVRQPLHAIGREAVQRLLARINGSDAPAQRVLLAPTLVTRASCGAHRP